MTLGHFGFRSFFPLVVTFSMSLLSMTSAHAEPLKAPYNIHPARPSAPSGDTLPAPAAVPFRCPSAQMPPVRDLLLMSVYKSDDAERDDVDAESQAAYKEATRPLVRFENSIINMANDFAFSDNKASPSLSAHRAACVLDSLDNWAKEDAMLGETNPMGILARQWALASLSNAYLQIRSAHGLDKVQKKRVRSWLKDIAARVQDSNPMPAIEKRQQNNLMYWAAWSVTITGIATDDRSLFEWGMRRAMYALGEQMQDDGTLPLELARGKKALQYHNFALAPLIMMAEAGARNGYDLYGYHNGAIHKLVAQVLGGYDDSTYLQRASGGYPQFPLKGLPSAHFAWMEVYESRFNDPRIDAILPEARPTISRRLGGNLSLIYNWTAPVSPQATTPSVVAPQLNPASSETISPPPRPTRKPAFLGTIPNR